MQEAKRITHNELVKHQGHHYDHTCADEAALAGGGCEYGFGDADREISEESGLHAHLWLYFACSVSHLVQKEGAIKCSPREYQVLTHSDTTRRARDLKRAQTMVELPVLFCIPAASGPGLIGPALPRDKGSPGPLEEETNEPRVLENECAGQYIPTGTIPCLAADHSLQVAILLVQAVQVVLERLQGFLQLTLSVLPARHSPLKLHNLLGFGLVKKRHECPIDRELCGDAGLFYVLMAQLERPEAERNSSHLPIVHPSWR